MSEETELVEAQVRLRKNGDLFQRADGHDTVVAHYDKTSGHLEFASEELSRKLYQQVTARLGTVNNGTEPSNNVIRTIGIKGQTKPDLKKLPKRPKIGPAGDTAEEFVQWMLDNDMTQAIIRYGIYTDASGQPVRKNVRRVMETTTDRRDDTDDQLPEIKDGGGGKRSYTKGPIFREREVTDLKNQIIARRATPLTFTPNEVVGGYQPEDDFEDSSDATVGEEAE